MVTCKLAANNAACNLSLTHPHPLFAASSPRAQPPLLPLQTGQLQLIDNDVALRNAWVSLMHGHSAGVSRNLLQCAVDSVLLPSTQKNEILRSSFRHVMKLPPLLDRPRRRKAPGTAATAGAAGTAGAGAGVSGGPAAAGEGAASMQAANSTSGSRPAVKLRAHPLLLLDYRCHLPGAGVRRRMFGSLPIPHAAHARARHATSSHCVPPCFPCKQKCVMLQSVCKPLPCVLLSQVCWKPLLRHMLRGALGP